MTQRQLRDKAVKELAKSFIDGLWLLHSHTVSKYAIENKQIYQMILPSKEEYEYAERFFEKSLTVQPQIELAVAGGNK